MPIAKGLLDEIFFDTMIKKGPYFVNVNDKDFYSGFNGKFKIYALRRSTREGLGTGIKIGANILGLALGPIGLATSLLLTKNAVDPSSHYAWIFHFDNSNSDDLEYLLVEYGDEGIRLRAFIKQQNMSLYEASRYIMGTN